MGCEFCHCGIGHHPRCPEADEPVVVYECMQCKTEIYEGATYYHIGELIYCEECIFRFRKFAEDEN